MLKVSDWLNEKGKQYENIIQEALFRMRCCIPAIVQSYNATQGTIECQPTIREKITLPDGSSRYVNLPLLINVPVLFPSSFKYALKFPLSKGDEVLVFFSDLSLDNFWEKGNVQNPVEQRRHDLSDGLAFPANMSIPSNEAMQVTSIEFTPTDILFKAGEISTTLSTLAQGGGGQSVLPSSATPKMDSGSGSVGSENAYARGDHVHPTDTSLQTKITASGILKGNGSGAVSAATAGTDYQSPLVSGTNIKTINNTSLLGSGNISISGGSDVLFVAEYGTTTYADITAALNANKLLFCYVSWNDIVCPYIGVVNNQYAFSNLGAGESTVSLYVNSSNQWSYATSNLATRSEVNAKQDELVSGTNIKTINNESLLGSGNIDISGGGSSTLFVTVTYSNYAYTADTTYADMMSAISAGKNIVVILVDSNQQKTWYYTMTYAPKSGSSENFCFATENETGWISHLLVNAGNSWWAAADIDLLSYAKKASPTFTGTPKAPTAAAGTNTTQIATTAFVTTAINNAIGSAISASY